MIEHGPALSEATKRLEELLDEGPRKRQALLDMLDVPIATHEFTVMGDDERYEAFDCVERAVVGCLSIDAETSKRILTSRMAAFTRIDMPNARMPLSVVRRMATLGLNPLCFAVLAQLELPGIVLHAGPLRGLKMECAEAVRRERGFDLLPTFMLTEDYMWDSEENDITIIGRSLPDMVSGLVRDTPLDAIVSSPLTDGMGLHVARYDDKFEGLAMTLLLDGPSYVRLGEIPNILADPPSDWMMDTAMRTG